jgi:GntR family transcriptional regulator/MocR family aminotransferase
LKETILSDLLLQRLERPAGAVTGKSGEHMNRQLYAIIRQEILAGAVPAGSKLPASRLLAKEIGVSRNTVLYAYEQLLAEGYVTASTGSGTFVSHTVPDHRALHNGSATNGTITVPAVQQHPNRFALSRRGSIWCPTPARRIANGARSSRACLMSRCFRTRSGRAC